MKVNAASSSWAIIPARGGSKGIPNKNLQTINGIPLIARTIIAANSSKKITRVIVSTDSTEIAKCASKHGATIVKRPVEISEDSSRSEDAILHVLDTLEGTLDLPDKLAFLQCTSPFTKGEDIDLVLEAISPPNCNSSLSTCTFHGFIWSPNGSGINHNPHAQRVRRQELQTELLETGAIYAMSTEFFRLTKNRFCPPCKPVVVTYSGPEIDTPADLALCRSIAALTAG
ncbi:N-acylneuraminate cytidylyltransferase [Synechococcus sp. A18-46.1]|nr:N-acylneuraminate cytidylyltransferase [Synechococcus sp. A18-46.1]